MERLFIECSIRAMLIAVGTAAILGLLRVRPAAARHAAWTGVLAAMLLLPAWSAWGPRAGLALLPARSERPAVVMTAETPAFAKAEIPRVVSPKAPLPGWSWDAILFGVYLAGAGALLLRLVVGTIRARRLTESACAAPITVGLLRPRVILPECSKQWTAVQLDAVLAHERAHVRRRDPLVQWLALLNRAVFWFHPLAWWLERRLTSLAEEACDGVVLELGHDPGEYAEALLDMGRSVKEAGNRVAALGMSMPGRGLPHRVRLIFDGPRLPRISRTRIVAVAAACSTAAALFGAGTLERIPAAIALPLPLAAAPAPPELVLAQAKSSSLPTAPSAALEPKLEFEVASVQQEGPGPFRRGVTGGPETSDPEWITYHLLMQGLLREAYGVDFDRISGPDWFATDRFAIEAKVPPGATKEQVQIMLQNLLVARFGLAFHWTSQDFPYYELTIAKGGPKFKESAGPRAGEPVGGMSEGIMRETLRDCPMPELVFELGARLGTITGPNTYEPGRIVDHTGLTGKYDFTLEYALGPGYVLGGALTADPGAGPSLFEALEQQAGLKLEETKAQLQVLVIDRANRIPEDN
jgi:uncharacterized protein (TIGR03435 family)